MIWVREGVWEGAVDAALTVAGPDTTFTVLHLMASDAEDVMRAGLGGLFGRRHAVPASMHEIVTDADHDLMDAAVARLGRPAQRETREGRPEREVVLAAEHTDLLVVSRDGDRRRLGPHSLGPATRFVVDHAPCPVLLVWPEAVPAVSSISPPPAGPPPANPPRPNSA